MSAWAGLLLGSPRRRALAGTALAALLASALSGCSVEDTPIPALHTPAATPEDRPDTPGTTLQFRFDAGDALETFPSPSGDFLIHFTRAGRNAVPERDDDGSGVPDFVEEVAGVYDEVLAHHRDDLGFRPPASDEASPDNGGDGRFDVYLVDFAGVGDGAFRVDTCTAENREICAGFMTQENDYRGYGYPSTRTANRILASHELFHAIQAAYDSGQGSIMAEGTAVWATESFDRSLRDFEGFIDGYLTNCNRSLDVPLPGPVDPFSYGSAIFFEFLEERFGAGTIRALWERVENGADGEAEPVWFHALDPLLRARAQTSFAEAFVEFATWNLFSGGAADAERSYADGAGYPSVNVDDVDAPFSRKLRAFYASAQYYRVAPGGRAAMTAALASPAGADEGAGLALMLVPQRGATYGDVTRVEDVSAGAQGVDTSGADALIVVVVNGAQEGDSRRPTLCIGTPEEVATCREAVRGPAGGGGGGGGDAEPPLDTVRGDDDGGCACRATPAAEGGLFHAMALSAVALSRRRRRRVGAGALPSLKASALRAPSPTDAPADSSPPR